MNSFPRKKALLLGNGINRVGNETSLSWPDLLKELKGKFDIKVSIDNPFKPFPLAFEEMLFRKGGNNKLDEKLKTLKKGIRECIDNQINGKPGFSAYHQNIMGMGYDDILTTNYDYGLERSVLNNFFDVKDNLAQNKTESKHSLRRRYKVGQPYANVWHIHGELLDSRNLTEGSKFYKEESIMIGYEHYSSYLGLIQSHFKKDNSKQNVVENRGLLTRLREHKTGIFWFDVFFTHDLDIVGLGLDFSENHLWWLINQRAEHMRSPEEMSKVLIDNRIRFIFPQFEIKDGSESLESKLTKDLFSKQVDYLKAKAIGEVLSAFRVDSIPIKCKSYEEFYTIFTTSNYP